MQFPDIIFYYLLKQFKQKGSVKLNDLWKKINFLLDLISTLYY